MTVNTWRDIILVVLLVFLFSGACCAGEPQPVGTKIDKEVLLQQASDYFNQANNLYGGDPGAARDLYLKALVRFERLAGEGGVTNGKLYYNIGNCYYLLGDIGRAILNYRRAEQYVPADPNLRQNLSYVLSKRQDRFEEKQRQKVMKTLFFWHYDLTVKNRAFIFGLFYVSFWGLAAARLYCKRSGLLQGGVISLVIALLFLASLAVEHFYGSSSGRGVLLDQEVTARKGDGASYNPSFKDPLHAGTEFNLLEKRGNWWRVELVDGRQCWIPDTTAALVR